MAAPAYDEVGTYAGLQGMVQELMNRNDMSSVLPALIAYAEASLRRNVLIRNLKHAAFSIAGDGISVPNTMGSLETLVLDSDSYQAPLQVVGTDELARVKRESGISGVPLYVAVADGKFYFAPEPNGTYAATIEYWEDLTPLAEGANWLATAHPDIYLAATMVQAGIWAKDLETAQVWKMSLDEAIESAFEDSQDEHWGGGPLRKQYPRIGS